MMPLDSTLFNDLIELNGKAVVTTKDLPDWPGAKHPDADARNKWKWSMKDPENAWRTMSSMFPRIKPERIIHDIDKSIDVAIAAIIEAGGTIVEELDNRNGHRKVAARLTLAKLRADLHPDCVKAMEAQLLRYKSLVVAEGEAALALAATQAALVAQAALAAPAPAE